MHLRNEPGILAEKLFIESGYLTRQVEVDLFLPKNVADPAQLNLLLINDGQNLAEMNFQTLLESLYSANQIEPLICAGIHAGKERKMEYGIASKPDYSGRGARAGLYTSFLIKELLPLISEKYAVTSFKEKAMAGFSLGGLTALDIVWNHPGQFTKAGIFSGSFWWRSVDQNAMEYDDDKHRLMQQEIRNGRYKPQLKFFFQCGNMDEKMDRNKNGIIDSIDDTIAVIEELKVKGYKPGKDIHYMEMPDGRHDLATWQIAMPDFLKWGWGRNGD